MARSLFLCCERSFWQLATSPGGNVRDAHGGIRGVHVLSTLAARTVSIDADVLGLDDDFDAVVDFRRHEHAGKRRMPPLGLIEWRDADQAVHADFAAEQPEGIFTIDRERRRLQSGFFARLVVVEHRLESLPLGPSQVHAQQHVSPVLRLGAARAGMDGDDSVARIVFAGEQRLSFQLIDQFAERIDFALQVGVNVLAFLGEVEIGGDVVAAARQISVGREHVLQALLLAHHLLRTLRDSTTDSGRRPAFRFQLVADGLSPRQRYSRRSWTFLLSFSYSCSNS